MNSTSNNKEHIVVVDDDPNIQELLEMLLKEEGYKVTGFKEFPGIESIIDTNPDLIILDIMMPNTNGIELSQLLKNHPRSNAIPMLGLSASSGDQLTGLQCEDFVAKPFDIDNLLSHIYNLLKGKTGHISTGLST